MHLRAQVRRRLRHTIHADTGHALDDQAQAAIGQLEHLVDVRERAGGKQPVLPRVFLGRRALGKHANLFVARNRRINQRD